MKGKRYFKKTFSKKDIKELSLEMSKEISEETNIGLRAIEYFALENEIVPLRLSLRVRNRYKRSNFKIFKKRNIFWKVKSSM